jgi:hypothetical protein
MQQIAELLEKLGLSEYAQGFAENDIDFAILGDLTDQDLEKIGVASLGHRRKLLRAIAELNSAPSAAQAAALVTSAPLPAAVVPPPIAAPIAAVEAAGERRYLTVMFCDLVGRPAFPPSLMPRSGATWSAPICMRPVRR